MNVLVSNSSLVLGYPSSGRDDIDNRINESVTIKNNSTISSTENESPNSSVSSNETATPQPSTPSASASSTTILPTPANALNLEENRLKTFDAHWPHSFISPRILAKTGFYFFGPNDQVKCYFCKVEVCSWEAGDNEVTEHLRWSPNCSLLKRRDTTNIPLEPIDELDQLLPPISYDVCGTYAVDIDAHLETPSRFFDTVERTVGNETAANTETHTHWHPDFPEFAIETARLCSFDEWPKMMKQKPKQLSDAGFFYTQKSDRVICFSCGGGLRGWEEGDDPWEQHALWYDKCEYLRLIKGPQFIQSVKEKFATPQTDTDKKHTPTSPSPSESVSCTSSSCACAGDKDDQNTNNKLCESRLCKICYTNEYNTAFLPCGHVIACSKCASSVTKCPMCRKPFERVMRVFFS